jgi:hypothetical protein
MLKLGVVNFVKILQSTLQSSPFALLEQLQFAEANVLVNILSELHWLSQT